MHTNLFRDYIVENRKTTSIRCVTQMYIVCFTSIVCSIFNLYLHRSRSNLFSMLYAGLAAASIENLPYEKGGTFRFLLQ